MSEKCLRLFPVKVCDPEGNTTAMKREGGREREGESEEPTCTEHSQKIYKDKR